MHVLFGLLLILMAAPAGAVTYNLIGSSIDACESYVADRNGNPKPRPCRNKIGRSFDGSVTIDDSIGPLAGQLLVTDPIGDLSRDLLDVRLRGLRWNKPGVERHAGMLFDDAGNLDKWWFTVTMDGGNTWIEAASQGIHKTKTKFYAWGQSGEMLLAPTAQKLPAPVPMAAAPIPAPALLLVAGLGCLTYVRRRHFRPNRFSA